MTAGTTTAGTAAEPALLAVDAGGSRTRVLVASSAGRCSWETGSINPHAAGPGADRTLHLLLTAITDMLASRPVVGWIASASVDPDHAGPELKRLAASVSACAGQATGMRLLASNDVMPLLWGVPALAGQGVAVVCGTGSCFIGANRSGQVVRAGGCEYLGSDEGSAAHLGWRGLCAAVRAADGRGPRTTLVSALSATCGGDVAWLARQLAAQPFPKQRLAALAPAVCAAWCEGDLVAAAIVRDALAELATGVRARGGGCPRRPARSRPGSGPRSLPGPRPGRRSSGWPAARGRVCQHRSDLAAEQAMSGIEVSRRLPPVR